MKAIVHTKYGPPEVLHLMAVEKPTPKDDEVLIRVHAASVHADIWQVVSGLPYALRLMGAGLYKPKNPIPGTDVARFVSQLRDMDFSQPSKQDSMAILKEFLAAGKITPVIDRTFSLSEVPEALRYLQEGQVKGKVIINVEQNS